MKVSPRNLDNRLLAPGALVRSREREGTIHYDTLLASMVSCPSEEA
jgi:hypothetical protein